MSGLVFSLDEMRRSKKRRGRPTFFTRPELNALLSIYSRRVASGEWRDYAIDHRTGLAVFSIFRHSHERPLYSIAKRVAGGGKSGEYLLYSGRERLARGASLSEVLTVFDRKLQVVS